MACKLINGNAMKISNNFLKATMERSLTAASC